MTGIHPSVAAPIVCPCSQGHTYCTAQLSIYLYFTSLSCTIHYPTFTSDVHGFNCSSTSHFTKGKRDSVFFSEQMLRSAYSTVHALGLVPAKMLSSPTGGCAVHYTRVGWMLTRVPASTLPRYSTGTSPRACTNCLVCQLGEPFADKLLQVHLSGCIRLGPM